MPVLFCLLEHNLEKNPWSGHSTLWFFGCGKPDETHWNIFLLIICVNVFLKSINDCIESLPTVNLYQILKYKYGSPYLLMCLMNSYFHETKSFS